MTDWVNTYSVVITTVATACIAVSAAITAWLTRNLFKENQVLRKAETEPEVAAYLTVDSQRKVAVNFVLTNVGRGPARNVVFNLQIDENDFASHNVGLMNLPDRKVTTMLPAGQSIEMFFGVGHYLLEEPRLRPFNVTVKCEDLKGGSYEFEYILDVAQFEGFSRLGNPIEYEIMQILKKIEGHISKLSRGR